MYIVDIFFSIDIIINFNTAILKDNDLFEIEDDRKKIASTYIKSWFFIDLISVIPFEMLTESLIPVENSGS